MRARFQAWLEELGDQFWLRPAVLVLTCLMLAQGAIWLESTALGDSGPKAWGYSGGAEGARTLLSAVASSAIGVAGTIFSITIAALSLASGQMGPRLLRNFIRDGRNQLALGVFVGTFAYALVVLRTVRTVEEQAFVPHAAVTGAIVLALACVATLVWFVHHVATSINVETVVDSIHADFVHALKVTALDAPGLTPIDPDGPGEPVSASSSAYLQAVDARALADWAAEVDAVVRLRARPGDYVPPGQPVADVHPPREGARGALDRALAFGHQPTKLQDLEYAVRQLNEIAVRALSPGTNDPFTAGSVIERFGDVLCRLASRHLPTGVTARDGTVRVLVPVTGYRGLCDAMFHTIRQSAEGSAFVLIRLIDVLTKVVEVERAVDRVAVLRDHAALARETATASLKDRAALADLEERWARFEAVLDGCPTPSRR